MTENMYRAGVSLINSQLTLGVKDCENNLMEILDALGFILEHAFKPKCTILTDFRFDKKMKSFELRNLVNNSEPQGASHIADLLKWKR